MVSVMRGERGGTGAGHGRRVRGTPLREGEAAGLGDGRARSESLRARRSGGPRWWRAGGLAGRWGCVGGRRKAGEPGGGRDGRDSRGEGRRRRRRRSREEDGRGPRGKREQSAAAAGSPGPHDEPCEPLASRRMSGWSCSPGRLHRRGSLIGRPPPHQSTRQPGQRGYGPEAASGRSGDPSRASDPPLSQLASLPSVHPRRGRRVARTLTPPSRSALGPVDLLTSSISLRARARRRRGASRQRFAEGDK